MRKLIIVTLLACTVLGCAAIQQARQDAEVGYTAPLAANEISPQQKAQTWGSIIAGIPYAGVAAPFAVPVLGWIFAWRRGAKIRKQQPASANPITGQLGNALGAETIIQHIADVRAGVIDVGAPESSTRRTWKGIVIGALGIAASSGLQHIAGQAPSDVQPAIWALVSAVILGAEKWLQKVLPVQAVQA